MIADEFNNFFDSIGPQLANHISNTVSPLSYVHRVVNSIEISTITTLEVRNIIYLLKIVVLDGMIYLHVGLRNVLTIILNPLPIS